MSLPNLSYMMSVGHLRYIQSAYEVPEHRNPDVLVRHFLSTTELWNCRMRGWLIINRLRKNPFYYYVLARTRYYDKVFSEAISAGVTHIINIGCGSDTRAYRFAGRLKGEKVICVECDQEAAILGKEKLARENLDAHHVQFMAIDLNQAAWPGFDEWLRRRQGDKVLVMMEGVSPYIDEGAFLGFLDLMASRLNRSSTFAYDFKIKGVSDEFGRARSDHRPFRLLSDAAEVVRFHESRGFSVKHLELGSDLVSRTISGRKIGAAPFSEDALVQLVPK